MIPNVKLEYQWIDKSLLLTERGLTGYQRTVSPHGRAVINKIKKNFLWPLFGALLVVRRKDGDLFVVDGGHRLDAVKEMESITGVPCLICHVDTVSEEAAIFRRFNADRRQLTQFDEFRPAIIEGDKIALVVADICKAAGRAPGPKNTATTVSFLTRLRKSAAANETATRAVFGLLSFMSKGQQIDRRSFEVLFWIECELMNNRPGKSLATTWRREILAIGALPLRDLIRIEASHHPMTGSVNREYARAVIKRINQQGGEPLQITPASHGGRRPKVLNVVPYKEVEIASQIGRLNAERN